MKNNENEVFTPPPPPPEYVEQSPQGYVQHPSTAYVQQLTPGYVQQNTPGYVQQPLQGYAQQPTPGYVQQPLQGYVQHPTPGYVQHPISGYVQQPGPAIVPIAVPTKAEDSNVIVCLNLISVITHILLGAVAMGAFIYINVVVQLYRANASYLSSHVYLTIIGYGVLFTQAVLSLKPYEGWGNNLLYPQKNSKYWIVQILGSILAIIGCVMGLVAVKNFRRWHMTSAHAIVGLITLILTIVSFVGGIINVVNQNTRSQKQRTLHTYINILVLILAFIAICLVFITVQSLIISFRFILLPVNANVLLSFTIFTIAGFLLMVFVNISKRGIMLN